MLLIQNEKYFDETVAFAKQIGLYDPPPNSRNSNHYLRSRLDYLATYGGKNGDGTDKTRVRLFKDLAPYSFGFVIESQTADGQWSTWFNGGLLFHGAHDGHGSGAGPTFAVLLDSSSSPSWAIHT